MAKILISGGSGLLGKAITDLFISKKHEVVVLSRHANSTNGIQTYQWDWKNKSIDLAAFDNVDVLIHLAGAGIVDKAWTPAYKKEIIDSRVKSSQLLIDTIQQNKIPLKQFIGASAVGYYGAEQSAQLFTETSAPGHDFMGDTCVKWEAAYAPFEKLADKMTIFRISIVLASQGGALPKMSMPFKYGFGAALASGQQYFPWIHIDDLSNLFLYAVENPQLNGTFNAVAPEIVTNQLFSKKLAKSLNRPFFLPNVPEFLLKLILGERHLTLTRGLKISCDKLIQHNFHFQYGTLDAALNALNPSKAR